jgi:hypothetical protein
MPDDLLAEVAGLYNAAVADGRPPVKAVQQGLRYSRSHAGRLVGQARAAGFIRATSPGLTSTVAVTMLKPVDAGRDDARQRR